MQISESEWEAWARDTRRGMGYNRDLGYPSETPYLSKMIKSTGDGEPEAEVDRVDRIEKAWRELHSVNARRANAVRTRYTYDEKSKDTWARAFNCSPSDFSEEVEAGKKQIENGLRTGVPAIAKAS